MTVATECNVFEGVVFVRYWDHVRFNRADPLVMSPQMREAVGWLVYACEHYVTIKYDQNAGSPTLKGGDPQAAGLAIRRSDILEMKKFDDTVQRLKEDQWGVALNASNIMHDGEYALSATKVKNSQNKKIRIGRGKYK